MAGSTAKKLGKEEGTAMATPLVEFYYKDDALADPFVSDDQALYMQAAASKAELDELRANALKINQVLKQVMASAGLELVDFKLEFGRDSKGQLLLADEISPDTCRLWDSKTGDKLDKDRFRRDLGRVEESYEEVLKRLKGVLK
jgi:phosphoribosylaminoimidazole-succinocarboxamide synthase